MQTCKSNFQTSLTFREPEIDSSDSTDPQSGSTRLLTSFNRKLVIKMVDSDAVGDLLSILAPYHSYIVQHHGQTLLPQFLGLYRICIDGTATYFLVMRNIFGGKYSVHQKFDLKGLPNRRASEKEKGKGFPTLKDYEFLASADPKIMISSDAKQQLISLLKRDTDFLSSLNLMNYSLLVGIHDLEAFTPSSADGSTSSPDTPSEDSSHLKPFKFPAATNSLNLDDEFFGVTSSSESPKEQIYYFGLIDVLNPFGLRKRTESAAKTIKNGARIEHSIVKPEIHATRLLDFVNSNILSPQN